MRNKKPMREAMPEIAAWVDDLRAAFGRETIGNLIRASVHDRVPGFYARENGQEIGVRPEVPENVWRCEGLEDRYVDGRPARESNEAQ